MNEAYCGFTYVLNIRCSQEEYDLSLYGLFDGFNSHLVSEFALKRMPAELLLGQLSQNSEDETVR